MLLAREFIYYLSRKAIAQLSPKVIQAAQPEVVAEAMANLIIQELEAEDVLNDEVRQILEQYSSYMRQEGISYSEMFRKIKNQLIAKKKIIRASGRDTGDNMKISRDKINDISHKLVTMLQKTRTVRMRNDPNEVRLETVRVFTELLQHEDKADRDARSKVRSIGRDIPEGTEEWTLLHKKFYAEELKKLGIDLSQ